MIAREDLGFVQFVAALARLEAGSHTGSVDGRRYSVSIERPVDGRVTKLFARELGGSDVVSFNLFAVGDHESVLRPCEMSSQKVINFVLQFERQSGTFDHET